MAGSPESGALFSSRRQTDVLTFSLLASPAFAALPITCWRNPASLPADHGGKHAILPHAEARGDLLRGTRPPPLEDAGRCAFLDHSFPRRALLGRIRTSHVSCPHPHDRALPLTSCWPAQEICRLPCPTKNHPTGARGDVPPEKIGRPSQSAKRGLIVTFCGRRRTRESPPRSTFQTAANPPSRCPLRTSPNSGVPSARRLELVYGPLERVDDDSSAARRPHILSPAAEAFELEAYAFLLVRFQRRAIEHSSVPAGRERTAPAAARNTS